MAGVLVLPAGVGIAHGALVFWSLGLGGALWGGVSGEGGSLGTGDPAGVWLALLAGVVAGLTILLTELLARSRRGDHERLEHRTLFHLSPAMLAVVDVDGVVLEVNDALSRTLGYAREELLGRAHADKIHPDDLARIRAQWASDRARRLLPARLECRVRGKDGVYRHLRGSEAHLPETGRFYVAFFDVTELSEATERGERAEHQAKVLIENIRDGLWIWDVDNDRPEYFSPGMGVLWGATVQELMSSPGRWLEQVLDEDRAGCLRQVACAIRDGQFEDEYRLRLPDGSVRWVRCRGRLFVDPGDGRRKIAGTSEDITDRHAMQAALGESERRFREIAETVREVFWVASPDTRTIEYISPAYETLWGRSVEAVLRDGEDWYNSVHPDDVGWVRSAFEGMASGAEYDATYRVVHPNGGVRWVRDRGFPAIGPDGSVERIVGLIQDLTSQMRAEAELRDSEARFREIVETTQEGILLVGPDGVVGYANDRMCELLGRGLAQVLGRTVPDLLPGSAREPLEMLLQRVGVRAEPRDVRIPRADGRTVEALVSAAALRAHTGEARGFIAMFTDITERRRAERDLLQAQKMEAVGQLASGVAHDFNNLLSAIGTHLRLAQSTLEASHPARQSLATVQEAADQAAGVTRSLLTFSRRSDPARQTVWIGDAIEQTARLLRRAMPANIALETPTLSRERDPLYVDADPTQLQQALMNLCLNARDAMPRGGTVRIRAERAESLGGVPGLAPVRLIVSDTGGGIPPELHQRIFEPFFTTKTHGDRTGLGLAITHGIVTRHNGTIALRSAPGQGAVFTIELPGVAPPVRDAEPTTREAVGGGKFVMIATANAHVGQFLSAVLRAEDYRVEVVSDGETLLAQAGERRGDKLLLIDLEGGAPDGLGCLRRLRAGGDTSTVILITSGDVPGDEAADLGAALLHKPFQVSDVPGLLARASRTNRPVDGVGSPPERSGGDAMHHEQKEAAS
ncbi:MAG: PAS domain S-box protein [Phycisphaerales bacterium]|nr:MAG: PAS domain S-box protein [Phycisphaerales bacterium]